MSDTELRPDEAVPEGVDVASAEGDAEEVQSAEESTNSLSLEDINKMTGRNYKSLENAQKAVKETFAKVGEFGNFKDSMEALKAQLNTDEQGVIKYMSEQAQNPQPEENNASKESDANFLSREEYERERFFDKNPDYAKPEIQDYILSKAKADGVSPSEVVEQDSFKALFSKVNTAEEYENSRTVLESNPRLGATKDSMSEAQKLMDDATRAKISNDPITANRAQVAAQNSALNAVAQAYGLRGK